MNHIQAAVKILMTMVIMTFSSGLAIEVHAQTANPTVTQEPDTDVDSVTEGTSTKLPNVYSSDFENGADEWQFIDEGWKVKQLESTKVLSQHIKKSNYKPEFRSPLHIALLKDKTVKSFKLNTQVLSTHKDYDHRDACLFFGYQSPTQYYYVHLGKKMDPRANQIFIVNNAARAKISLTTTDGTDWDENWHQVRIDRDATSGDIKVYFDDMENPAMTAVDKTFTWGQVGVGSFHDTADWDDFTLNGFLHETDDGKKESPSAKGSSNPAQNKIKADDK